MGFYSHWQPLVDENAHTALAFGFFRHAPTALALNPWLTKVLDREVTADTIQPANIWPPYPSIVEGWTSTEPDVVFRAHDGEPLTVVIEAKPGHGRQSLDQITREAVDVSRNDGCGRVACVMLAADLGPPMPVCEWRDNVRKELAAHGLGDVAYELHYASWASVGSAIQHCGRTSPNWALYAEDVVEQLRLNVLMGYDGAPSVEGLEGGLTMRNAVELYYRMLEAGRQLYLAVHGQKRFEELALRPYWASHRILRDGFAEAPAAGGNAFATTVLLSLYRKAAWSKGQNVFVSIDLSSSDEPELVTGAGLLLQESNPSTANRWAWADEPSGLLGDERLDAADKAVFPHAAEFEPGAKWIYDTRPWIERRGEADISWVIEHLRSGVALWDAT